MIRILTPAEARDLRGAAAPPPHIASTVAKIVEDVRARGDAALLELTERFDGPRLPSPFLEAAAWDALAARCSNGVRTALETACVRVRAFHTPQVPRDYEQRLEDGGILQCLAIPLERAACYVPGGRAVYPSTVVMTVPLARLAGVGEVIVATPPRRDGSIAPEVACAARIAGADRILLAGGAQAVAALALGTATVPRVDVIVGPGNAWVTEAKRQLAGAAVRIDSLAGPTEVAIVADGSADAAQVAVDLVAQAEHDPLALPILITHERDLVDRTVAALERELREHPNAVASESRARNGAAIVTRDLDESLRVANELAPEHLELLLRDAARHVARVPRAAAVFVGPFAPVPVGDYFAGPNHTLPTSGTARFASPLGVADFVRRQNVIEYPASQLERDGDSISTLARAEGLPGHARAIEARRRR